MLRSVASAPAQHPGYLAGVWYGSEGAVGIQTTSAVAANTLYAHPLVIRAPVTISQLGLRSATAVAGVRGKVGLYSNGSDGKPGALLREISADLDMGATGSQAAALAGGNLSLGPGVYWAASCFDGAAQPATISNATTGGITGLTGAQSAAGLYAGAAYVRLTRAAALTYATGSPFFPATFGAATLGNGTPGAPLVGFLAA